MQFDTVQRRRLAVALAATAIAVPAVFAFGDDDTNAEPSFSTTVGSVVLAIPDPGSSGSASESNRAGSADTDPMGTSVSAFLQGSGTLPPAEPATIAIPRLPDVVVGTATFRRSLFRPTSCIVRSDAGAPLGGEITVTNRNNSRSVRCVFDTTEADLEGRLDDLIVLHPDALAEIGDLTDAPLPVQLTW